MARRGRRSATVARISLGRWRISHLRRDGVVELVAVGSCWHGGTGYWPGLGRHVANQRMIGIECQNDGGGSPGKPHRSSWPDAQYDALVKLNAAFCRRIDADASHCLSHKEYDQGDPPTAEGKWDPGAIDMPTLRNRHPGADQPQTDDDRRLPHGTHR
ncbi:N-acetylmuramoyl-L-alanine amidase [Mycolicibacterium farcinogenes]|nr:N-acetylmuramoyl-L-alanine amidase [Mycolicibacterium farcinogenes]